MLFLMICITAPLAMGEHHSQRERESHFYNRPLQPRNPQ